MGKDTHPSFGGVCFFFLEFMMLKVSTRENPGKLKVHLCAAKAHSVTERTKGPCGILA